MSMPPPFSAPMGPPPAPPKRNNTILIIVLVVFVLIPCVGLIAGGFFAAGMFKNSLAPMAECAITFQEVRDAVLDYADEKGQLPKAATWQDDVKSFYAARISSKKDKYGPFEVAKPDGEWGCKTKSGMTGMAFNEDLSGKKLKDIKDHRTTTMIFEVEKAGKNLHQKYKPRPSKDGPEFIFNEKRPWLDMPISGHGSGNDMKFD